MVIVPPVPSVTVFALKVAVQARASLMVTSLLVRDVPVQAPLQPENQYPLAETAVRVVFAPSI